jgi:uncharacterized OB-fold protein
VAVTGPPRPLATALTRFFWDGLAERRLLIQRCSACRHWVHYPRPRCPWCQSPDLAPEEVSGRGELYAFTVTVQAFHPFFADRLPYVLALVELAEQEGLRLTTQVVGCDEVDLRIGMPLELVWTDLGDLGPAPFFRPAGVP